MITRLLLSCATACVIVVSYAKNKRFVCWFAAAAAAAGDGDYSYKARLCVIVTWPDFDGFGFNLHAERGKPAQYVGKVDAQSPAEAAGVREGDRIVAVNGVDVADQPHQEVVRRIRSEPGKVPYTCTGGGPILIAAPGAPGHRSARPGNFCRRL